ncbi:MAG: ABC transporter C-terminal domain-containing protein, partial [Prevotellaceae bacterium]|nr:ABC transporter C-terminal domain-containing protein [Prevotellaceae bacterium]
GLAPLPIFIRRRNMAEQNKKYLDLNGLGYAVRKINKAKADIESPVFTGTPTVPTPTADADKKQIANIAYTDDTYVKKIGDTMTGPLKFQSKTLPILDLKFPNPSNGAYSLATNASIFIGDATSNSAARIYYSRNIPVLNTALLTSTSIGYNPKDQAHWTTSSDYGMKFDINVASNTIERPSAIRQCASFFVGLNGAYVGYSGSATTALTDSKVYRLLDSNSVKQDEYIKSLEQRIADLESKITALENKMAEGE